MTNKWVNIMTIFKTNMDHTFEWGKQRVPRLLWSILRAIMLIGLCFMILYPVMLLLTRSFMAYEDMSDSSVVLFPKHISLSTLALAANMLDYGKSLLITFAVVASVAFLQTLVSLMVGYGFARYDIPFKNVLFLLVIFTIVVPPQLYLSSLYLHFKDFDIFGIFQLIRGEPLHLVNSYTPIYLMSATASGLKNGLFIYIFRQNFRNMPKEIEEAAYVDGSGHVGIFARIMIPNAVATIVTVVLFSFVWVYNDNVVSGMLLGNSSLLSVKYLDISEVTVLLLKDFGVADALSYNPIFMLALKSAGVLLVITPLILLYLLLQRFFVDSVVRSGVVG